MTWAEEDSAVIRSNGNNSKLEDPDANPVTTKTFGRVYYRHHSQQEPIEHKSLHRKRYTKSTTYNPHR
jgi:hypothetical protein